MVRERRGTDFDPDLAGSFLQVCGSDQFWDLVELPTAQPEILAMRPPSSYDALSSEGTDTVCEVLADFADVKSRTTWNHSLTVADVTTQLATAVGIAPAGAAKLRRAALVHDLGTAAVPVGILDKGDLLSPPEWERFRLHPHYTEIVLERIAPLQDLARDAGSHHELLDGQGYPRQIAGGQISTNGRILAVADTFVTALRGRSGEEHSLAALAQLRPLAGRQLDGGCVEALEQVVAGRRPHRQLRASRQGGLTRREVEVLGAMCSGLGNRGIAQRLFISEKTVEHHLGHIFSKLGVSSRTSAVVLAVQQGLAGDPREAMAAQ